MKQSILITLANALRRLIARIQWNGKSITPIQRVTRTLLFFPLYGLFHAALGLHALRHGGFKTIVETHFGARFHCTWPDTIDTVLLLFGVWEPDLAQYLRANLAPGDTFLDVGANIGCHTLLASQLVGNEGRVVAIEASPSIFAALRENLALNGDPANVRAVNIAAAPEKGRVTIYRGPSVNKGLSSTVKSRMCMRECEVDAAPLEDILAPGEMARLRLVKIDIEGGEESLLPAMGPFLKTCPPETEFIVELTPMRWGNGQSTYDNVLKPFLDAGYHPYRMPNSHFPWRYLWPEVTGRPKRIHGPIRTRQQIEIVLSRSTEILCGKGGDGE